MSEIQKFETETRWPGAPRTCSITGKMAFESDREIGRFVAENCPRASIKNIWTCQHCEMLHFVGSMDDRTGDGNPPSGYPFLGERRIQKAMVKKPVSREKTLL